MTYSMDETDYQILDILQRDGRITMRELAEQITMSSPAATERVRRMEDAGIIQGYRALINPSALSLPVYAIITADIAVEKRRVFYNFVANCREMYLGNCFVSGGNEAVVFVHCRDNRHLLELQQDLMEIGYLKTYIIDYKPFKDVPVDARLGREREYQRQNPVPRAHRRGED